MGSKKPAGRRERRVFSDEFKAEAVRMMQEGRAAGRSLAQIGRELDVRPDQLRALRRELATLQQEQAFLKKAAAYFAKESR